VILATAKLTLQDAIEASAFGDDPATTGDLVTAFPPAMRKAHIAAIEGHRLRREIVATKLANRIVNRLGLIHPFELAEEEGCPLVDVAEAFVIAEQVHGIAAIWDAIDSEAMPESARLMLFEQVAIEMRAHMADILRNAVVGRRNDHAIAEYQPVVALLSTEIEALLPPEAQRQTREFAERLAKAGAPRKIVERLVRLAQLDGAIGIAALATRMRLEPVAVTRAFTAIGEALGIDWAQGAAMQLDPHDPWERLLAAGLARDFQAMRLDFLARLSGTDPEAGVATWIATQATRVTAFHAMIDRARLAMPTTAMLAQIAGQARVLLGR
jgi:glutamate dehydrogenase